MSAGSLSFAKLVMMSSAPANLRRMPDTRPKIHGIQSTLSHTISTPIRSAFFLRRTQLLFGLNYYFILICIWNLYSAL